MHNMNPSNNIQKGEVFSSRAMAGLNSITSIEELLDLKSKWITDIDNNSKSTIFHTWEWVYNCLKVQKGGWCIYLGYDENDSINFMIPTYVMDNNTLSYLGCLYSDYTDPFCTEDDYFSVMSKLNLPSIYLPKSHKISGNVSSICLYSHDCSDIKPKFIKDIKRQKKKLNDYTIFIDKGNKLGLWSEFHDYWKTRWSNKWDSNDQELFKEFVINNKSLNAGILLIDNNPAAINLHTIHNGLCIFWVISMDPNIKFSAGNFLWYELMKLYEKDSSVTKMNAGIGKEHYKCSLFKKEEILYANNWSNN